MSCCPSCGALPCDQTDPPVSFEQVVARVTRAIEYEVIKRQGEGKYLVVAYSDSEAFARAALKAVKGEARGRCNAPTCFTGWKQVTDDCPVCGPFGPCVEPEAPPERMRPSLKLRFMAWLRGAAR